MLRAVRHDHHRRGARAQPQHRLPARLPQAAAAAPARPQADHHLGDHRPGALRRSTSTARPIVEVSGRTYPVEVRYRPLVDADAEEDGTAERARPDPGHRRRGRRAAAPRAPATSWCSSAASARSATPPTRCAGTCSATPRSCRCTRRLSAAEQHRVFAPHPGRRIVLATNVAETSLTVPGIRYVVDPGTARISRYSHRLKVQRLPIEPVSQASANQRKGRCGRVADGICIRLYSEEDFLAPAGVHRPGDPAHQPGVGHPADDRARARRHRRVPVRRAAGPPQHHATALPCCRSSARSTRPVPTRHGGSPRSAASWPSCRSTRGWPAWCSRPTATAACARCWSSPPRCRSRTRASGRRTSSRPPTRSTPGSPTTDSDFLAYLNLWRYLQEQQQELSSSQFRRLCRDRVPELPAGARVAGPAQPAAPGGQALGIDARAHRPSRRDADARPTRVLAHRRCWPGCSRTSA